MEESKEADALKLSQALFKHGKNFDFYHAVTLMERFHTGAKVGEQGPVKDEALCFRGHPSMAFPAGDLARIGSNRLGQYEIETNFIGLYGPSSPMPAYITEAVIKEQCQIEKEDSLEFFMSTESEVRSLRDGRLNIHNQQEYAKKIRKRIKEGEVKRRYLEDIELDKLRQGIPLEKILKKTEFIAFRKAELVLSASERATARQRDFFDIFNHRLTSLLYRSWRKYRPQLQYQAGAKDEFSLWLYSLMGAPGAAEQKSSALNWPKLLGYIGMISMRSRSVNVISTVVSGYFDAVDVRVEQYVERWVNIVPEQQCRLGDKNSQLGRTINLGSKVRDRSGKFRLVIGPLDFSQFSAFLPQQANHAALLELIQFLMPDHLCFDIELILKSSEVPSFKLGEPPSTMLGWSGWIGNAEGKDQRVLLNGLD